MSATYDSTQLGFVRETNSPLEDPGFTDLIQQMVVGITGLPGSMVRPRWQDNPPNQPPKSANWCAMGVNVYTPQNYPYIFHDPNAAGGMGQDVMLDWSTFEVLASFYGPAAVANAGRLRRGCYIDQNLDTLIINGINLREVGEQRNIPDIFNNQYVDRCDVSLIMSRETISHFPIRNIISASTVLITDTGASITADTDLTVPEIPFILDDNVQGILDEGRVLT